MKNDEEERQNEGNKKKGNKYFFLVKIQMY